MKPEEKQLLLKDLCGRLSYGVVCSIYREDDFKIGWRDEKLTGYFFDDFSYEFYFGESPISVDNILKIKPYLRPMSSMTEEERCELRKFCRKEEGILYDIGISGAINASAIIDYLNAHHFDYRNLIEKGLALEAPEDMYEINDINSNNGKE